MTKVMATCPETNKAPEKAGHALLKPLKTLMYHQKCEKRKHQSA